MITVEQLTYNPFQENTFLVYDETNDCVVIDPGMYTQEERTSFENLIDTNQFNIKVSEGYKFGRKLVYASLKSHIKV